MHGPPFTKTAPSICSLSVLAAPALGHRPAFVKRLPASGLCALNLPGPPLELSSSPSRLRALRILPGSVRLTDSGPSLLPPCPAGIGWLPCAVNSLLRAFKALQVSSECGEGYSRAKGIFEGMWFRVQASECGALSIIKAITRPKIPRRLRQAAGLAPCRVHLPLRPAALAAPALPSPCCRAAAVLPPCCCRCCHAAAVLLTCCCRAGSWCQATAHLPCSAAGGASCRGSGQPQLRIRLSQLPLTCPALRPRRPASRRRSRWAAPPSHSRPGWHLVACCGLIIGVLCIELLQCDARAMAF